MSSPLRTLVLIDGEHYPPVVRAAIEHLPERIPGAVVVGAALLGGGEKLAADLADDLGLGLPVVRGDGLRRSPPGRAGRLRPRPGRRPVRRARARRPPAHGPGRPHPGRRHPLRGGRLPVRPAAPPPDGDQAVDRGHRHRQAHGQDGGVGLPRPAPGRTGHPAGGRGHGPGRPGRARAGRPDDVRPLRRRPGRPGRVRPPRRLRPPGGRPGGGRGHRRHPPLRWGTGRRPLRQHLRRGRGRWPTEDPSGCWCSREAEHPFRRFTPTPPSAWCRRPSTPSW